MVLVELKSIDVIMGLAIFGVITGTFQALGQYLFTRHLQKQIERLEKLVKGGKNVKNTDKKINR